MNKDLWAEIRQIFKAIFEDQNIMVEEKTSAADIEKWDSMHHVLLISEIENKFGISFDLDELIQMKSVGDIVTAVARKTS